MIEVENAKVQAATMHQASVKIRRATGLPAALLLQMAIMFQEIGRAQDAAAQARTALLRDFAQLDEKGEPMHNSVEYIFPTPEKQQGFAAEFQKLMETKVKLQADTVTVDLKAIHEYQDKHMMDLINFSVEDLLALMALAPIFKVVLSEGAGG